MAVEGRRSDPSRLGELLPHQDVDQRHRGAPGICEVKDYAEYEGAETADSMICRGVGNDKPRRALRILFSL